MAALVVRDGPSAGQRVDIVGDVELGRADTEALREDAEASRRHATVRSGPSGLEIEDLGSSNGTWVNDERVAGSRALQAGDRVRIGQTTFEVEGEPDAGPVLGSAPASPETRVAPTPAAPAAGTDQPAAEPVAPQTPSEPPQPAEPAQPAAAQPWEPVQPAAPAQPVQPVAPAQPAAPAEPAQPSQPMAPAQPYQPDQAATAPQAPVGGGFGQQQGFGQQPQPYDQPAGAYGQPAGAYGQPGASGGRPAAVTVAGLLLILAGVVTILWTGYDVVLLLGDLESASAFGLSSLVYILLALNAVTLVGGLLEIVGGIRAFSLRGRGMAITGAVLVLVGWGAAIAYIVIQGFSVTSLAWIALLVSVGLTLAGLITLLSAGRHFSARRY